MATCRSPFLTESPIFNDLGIFEGREVKSVTIYDAACVRKLSVVMDNMGIVHGMKTRVSLIISVFVEGR